MGNSKSKNRDISRNQLYNLFKPEINIKKNICVGLNYPGTNYCLQGCVNDAKNMGKILNYHYNYNDSKILIDKDITNEYNILEILDELVNSKSKQLFFHYSGHGTQIADKNVDEIDGLDEVLFIRNGNLISDDDILKRVESLPYGKTLIMIFDCCHSGTMVDLPYLLTENGIVQINNKKIKGKIICITGCKDNQTSLDVQLNGQAYGALSSALIDELKKLNKNTTWRQLINNLRLTMKKKNYQQIPQLAVSDKKLIDEIVIL